MLEINNLKADINNKQIIKGLNLKINKGEVVGIMGPNGSGKSTLLRVIAGIYAPDNGSIKVRGKTTLLAGIGAGFQQDLTGRENINLTGSIYGFTQKEITNMEEHIIDFSGIKQLDNDKKHTNSFGMFLNFWSLSGLIRIIIRLKNGSYKSMNFKEIAHPDWI